MKRNTRLISIQNNPMIIFDSPELISDDIIKYNNFWEYELFNRWKPYFPSNGLMLDLGANIGNHCVQFKHHFPDLKIWAFEPYLENYLLLKQNTKHLNDIVCFNIGVGSRTSVVHFDDGQETNSGMVRVVDSSSNPNLVIKLDSIYYPESVNFVKIDVEGFETSAFEGMVNLLHRDKPIIWLEDYSGDAINFLEQNNYIIKESQYHTADYLMVHKHLN